MLSRSLLRFPDRCGRGLNFSRGFSSRYNAGKTWQNKRSRLFYPAGVTVTLTAAGVLALKSDHPLKGGGIGGGVKKNSTKVSGEDLGTTAGQWKEGLPVYTFEEVSKHDSSDNGVWVIYNNGVYDITGFVSKHPGGEILLVGAGRAIDPFWKIYSVHHSPDTHALLETMRIGNFDISSAPKEEEEGVTDGQLEDQWANEPRSRHPALLRKQEKPFNAEPPPAILTGDFHTPNDLFYVRNHLPVPPRVDPEEYRLEVAKEAGIGEGVKSIELSLDEIKSFPNVSISAVVQCGGNRRVNMSSYKPVRGLLWKGAAIGNACWTGVRLCDILKSAGITGDDFAGIKHVHFEGLDTDAMGSCYSASIPIETAMDPKRDVLLVFKMNDEDIPVDHGYPLRVLVPGTVGARSVKWVSRIILSTEESPSIWQRRDYKLFPPNVDINNVDYESSEAMQDMPVQSAICLPMPGSVVDISGGGVTVRGYAWSGGGRGISRVDVSVNGGRDWSVARLHCDPEQKPNRVWAWSLWEVTIPVSPHTGELDIVCKAVDSSCNNQPENVESIWNFRGLANNAWHHVSVKTNSSSQE